MAKKSFSSGIEQMLQSAEQATVSSIAHQPEVVKEQEVTINFKIPQSLHIALKVHVAQNGTSIKELVTKLLQKELN